jgi:hypothetical protein
MTLAGPSWADAEAAQAATKIMIMNRGMAERYHLAIGTN